MLVVLQAMSSSSQQLSGTRTAVAIGIASAEYNNYVVSRHLGCTVPQGEL